MYRKFIEYNLIMNTKLFYTILAIACVACLFSCKTAEQLYTKAKDKDDVKVAELARKDFPCTTVSIDTIRTVDTLFDLIEVECPPFETVRVDSFETVVVNTVKVKVPREVVTVSILERVEDSAKIKIMQRLVDDANATILAERERGDKYEVKYEEQRQRANKWRKWFFIIAASFGIAIYLRIKRIL